MSACSKLETVERRTCLTCGALCEVTKLYEYRGMFVARLDCGHEQPLDFIVDEVTDGKCLRLDSGELMRLTKVQAENFSDLRDLFMRL